MPNIYYAGPGGIDSNPGNTWELRKLTIAGLMNIFPRSGDRLYVAPGVYREKVTLNGKAEAHSWGTSGKTINVTNGSTIVTGGGTNWLNNGLAEGDVMFISFLVSGNGVSDAAGTFTDAGGNFLAGAIGFCINMHEQDGGPDGGSFKILAMAGGGPPHGAVTMTDTNGIGWPADGSESYVYTVPSNEGSYEIASCESNTQFTLKRPWSGPTYTNIPASTGVNGNNWDLWRPIYLTGDETGAHTDGVGGVCRITGSANDQTIAETDVIDTDGQDYWTITGFQLDSASTNIVFVDDSTGMTFEDIRTLNPESRHFFFDEPGDHCTVRRCAMFGGDEATGIELWSAAMRWDEVNHFENIYGACYRPFYVRRYANTTIKNCTNGMSSYIFLQTANIDLGGCVFIHDCEIHYTETHALWDAVNGQILVDWTNFWDCSNDILNGTPGANCETDLFLYIPDVPRLVDDYRYPVRFYPPSQWWGVAFQGLYAANEDIYGIPKPTTITKLYWGSQQTHYIERDTATIYGGAEASLEHLDARTTQFRIPISGEPLTVTVWVRREANYAGLLPKLVVHQAGNTDVEDTATGAVDTWEQLSVAYVPNATPPIVWASLVSDNTATGANIATYWQELDPTRT